MTVRLPTPAAYADPAFLACVVHAIHTPELVKEFDRLYGATLYGRATPIEAMVDAATGKRDDDLAAFVRFVHDAVYLRVEDKTLLELRAKAVAYLEAERESGAR